MNWGHKIAIAISIFIAFMVGTVIWAFQQDVNLVAENYYEEEIAYQKQIDKIKNTNRLLEKPTVNYRNVDDIVELVFPQRLLNKKIKGELHFFRPSDFKKDRKFELQLDEEGKQFISVATLQPGSWKVKLRWNDLDKEYFDEVNIYIQ